MNIPELLEIMKKTEYPREGCYINQKNKKKEKIFIRHAHCKEESRKGD